MGIVGHYPAELVALAHKSEAVPGVVVFLKLTFGFQLPVVGFLAAAQLFVPLGSVSQLPGTPTSLTDPFSYPKLKSCMLFPHPVYQCCKS